MISISKLNDYLNEFATTEEDEASEVTRFIRDLQIKIEFGHFESEYDEESGYDEESDPYA
jgi:hypothetical protein